MRQRPLRRQLVLGATAIGATMAGMGVARRWWADGKTEPLSPGPSPDSTFWAQQWDTPQGVKLAMQSFRGRPLLLNFWATWCPPCVDELPLINEFYRQNKANGWQVLGVAVDQLGPVQAFLKTHPLDFPIAMAGASGSALARSLGNMAWGIAPQAGPPDACGPGCLGAVKIAILSACMVGISALDQARRPIIFT